MFQLLVDVDVVTPLSYNNTCNDIELFQWTRTSIYTSPRSRVYYASI